MNDDYALGPGVGSSSVDDSHALFGQTMGLVALTGGCFTVGAYLGRDIPYQWGWLFFIAAFAALIGINFASQRNEQVGIGLLFGVGGLLGLALSPTIAYYAGTDPEALWRAGGAAALFMLGFGAAGYATRRDLSALARLLFWALFALIGYGVVLTFASLPSGWLVYSILGLVIFAGYVMFDFQRLRDSKGIGSAPQLAASIFLDILNVFLFFLNIFSGNRS
jgi:modulator of FtsH protease